MAKISTNLYGELAILPYQAEAPVKETLAFLTDVIAGSDSTEQRIQMRTKPRQTFDYKIPIQLWNKAASFNTEYGAIRKDWAIPIWTEAQYIGNVAASASSISCNTDYYDLRSNSLAMLYSPSGYWQIVEIGTLATGTIQVLNSIDAITSAWLMPVRKGWIKGNIAKPTNGNSGKTSISFVIDDNPFISASVPAQYLSNDIYFDVPLLGEGGDSVSASFSQQQDITDMSLGPVSRRSNWNRPQYGKPWRSLLTTPQEIRNYKNFLFRRAGKFRSFWHPTFENNMRLVNTGLVSTSISVKTDSFLEYAMLRTHIAVESNGSWYARAISNPLQIETDVIQFDLSSALNLKAENISRISYLGLNRLDADSIEFNWQGGGIVEVNVPVLELSP